MSRKRNKQGSSKQEQGAQSAARSSSLLPPSVGRSSGVVLLIPRPARSAVNPSFGARGVGGWGNAGQRRPGRPLLRPNAARSTLCGTAARPAAPRSNTVKRGLTHYTAVNPPQHVVVSAPARSNPVKHGQTRSNAASPTTERYILHSMSSYRASRPDGHSPGFISETSSSRSVAASHDSFLRDCFGLV
jgi:hypothetical protein